MCVPLYPFVHNYLFNKQLFTTGCVTDLMKECGPDIVQVTEQCEDAPLLLVVPQLNGSGRECEGCEVSGECGV